MGWAGRLSSALPAKTVGRGIYLVKTQILGTSCCQPNPKAQHWGPGKVPPCRPEKCVPKLWKVEHPNCLLL